MKIDFNTELKDLRGKPIPLTIDNVSVNATLLEACVESLMCLFDNERTEEGKSKYERWKLAEKLMKSVSGVVDLSVEEIAKLKKRVGKRYSPLIVGPAYSILDNVEDETSNEDSK